MYYSLLAVDGSGDIVNHLCLLLGMLLCGVGVNVVILWDAERCSGLVVISCDLIGVFCVGWSPPL